MNERKPGGAEGRMEHLVGPEEIFRAHWPEALRPNESYKVLCDDKGRNGGSWLAVTIANDGDVHVSMQDWEDVPQGEPDPFPSVRIRTYSGGGRHARTRQALLWLAEAIRLDTAPKLRPNDPVQPTRSRSEAEAKGSAGTHGSAPPEQREAL